MIERLRKVIEDSGLNFSEFAKRISKTPQYVWKIMNDDSVKPSESTIRDICREFGINEEWLKEGTGEVFAPVDDQTAAVVSDLLDNDNPLYNVILETVRIYQTLDDRSKDVINDFVDRLLEAKEG